MLVSSSDNDKKKAGGIVRILNARFGDITWWPGDADEVMIGAILTQQTRWENVDRALCLLKEKNLCSLALLHETDPSVIEETIRCTGFYRVKTRRLKALAAFVTGTCGGIEVMQTLPTATIRESLLRINGIGEETADSILCYAFGRPTFVIDAYTERITRCAGIKTPHRGLKSLFECVLADDPYVYHQTHAHIVEYAKQMCTKKRCEGCRIMELNG
jgi:endonuclease-3 related protein